MASSKWWNWPWKLNVDAGMFYEKLFAAAPALKTTLFKDTNIATQGVKLMNLDGGDLISAVARVVPEDGEGEGGEGEGGDEGGAAPDVLELTTEE